MSGSAWLSLGVPEHFSTTRSTHIFAGLLCRGPIHPSPLSSCWNGVACYHQGGSEAYSSSCGKWIIHVILVLVRISITKREYALTIHTFSALLAKTRISQASSWFSLSAHAFHGQVYGGQDGYTILRVPEGLEDAQDSRHEAKAGERAALPSVKHEYVLWEFSKIHHVTG